MTDTVASLAVEPRLNRRQAAKIRTRQKVLDAARSLFAERGYEPATIRDIAKGAGMSTGAVFANFQDKAELFEAVLTEDMTRLAEVVEAAAPKGEPVRQRLVTALSAGYHSSLDQLPLFQAIVARSWFQPLAAEMRARRDQEPAARHRRTPSGRRRQGRTVQGRRHPPFGRADLGRLSVELSPRGL